MEGPEVRIQLPPAESQISPVAKRATGSEPGALAGGSPASATRRDYLNTLGPPTAVGDLGRDPISQRTAIRRCRRNVQMSVPSQLDGVTGRRPTVVVAVVVPQDDEVGKRSQAGPAPSIIGGRPWSTMLVSTCHWKAPAYALWTQQGESCARPRWPASQRP